MQVWGAPDATERKKNKKKHYYRHVVSPSYSLAHFTDSQSKLSVQIQVAQDLPNLLTFKY